MWATHAMRPNSSTNGAFTEEWPVLAKRSDVHLLGPKIPYVALNLKYLIDISAQVIVIEWIFSNQDKDQVSY